MEKITRYLANSSTVLEQLSGLIHQYKSTPRTPLPTERELAETLIVGRREIGRARHAELWDSAFHWAIAEAVGNRLLLGLFYTLDAVRCEPG